MELGIELRLTEIHDTCQLLHRESQCAIHWSQQVGTVMRELTLLLLLLLFINCIICISTCIMIEMSSGVLVVGEPLFHANGCMDTVGYATNEIGLWIHTSRCV